MNTRRNLAAITLPVCLALAPFQASAQQESGVDGASAGLDAITGTALDTLACASVVIPATGSVWHCVATCSAEVSHFPGTGTNVDGRLAITRNGVEVGGTDRKFELNDNPGIDDISPYEVSTTGLMANLRSGTHRICCAAALVPPTAAGDRFDIIDSSITAACSDFIL